MRTIMVISGLAALLCHFAYGVPLTPNHFYGGAPLPFMFAIGTGLPVLFVCAAHAKAWVLGRFRRPWSSGASTAAATAAAATAGLPSSEQSANGRDKDTPRVAAGGGVAGAAESLSTSTSTGSSTDAVVDGISFEHPCLPALGMLEPKGEDSSRGKLLEQRMRKELTPDLAQALGLWAGYNKGLRLLLQQVV